MENSPPGFPAEVAPGHTARSSPGRWPRWPGEGSDPVASGVNPGGIGVFGKIPEAAGDQGQAGTTAGRPSPDRHGSGFISDYRNKPKCPSAGGTGLPGVTGAALSGDSSTGRSVPLCGHRLFPLTPRDPGRTLLIQAPSCIQQHPRGGTGSGLAPLIPWPRAAPPPRPSSWSS